MERAGVVDLPRLRGRLHVFRDRTDAGRVLARMLEPAQELRALVLAVPAGGVPVAAEAAQALGLDLDVAVVSKITLPWNAEAGYGAVAFDGTLGLNEALLPHLGLSQGTIQEGLAAARVKVARRVRVLRGERPPLDLSSRPAILVDDGLASGFTLQVAVQALRKAGGEQIWIAVPTGHEEAVTRLAPLVEALYCANLRADRTFAVADAYERWTEVSEDEAARVLQSFSAPLES